MVTDSPMIETTARFQNLAADAVRALGIAREAAASGDHPLAVRRLIEVLNYVGEMLIERDERGGALWLHAARIVFARRANLQELIRRDDALVRARDRFGLDISELPLYRAATHEDLIEVCGAWFADFAVGRVPAQEGEWERVMHRLIDHLAAIVIFPDDDAFTRAYMLLADAEDAEALDEAVLAISAVASATALAQWRTQ